MIHTIAGSILEKIAFKGTLLKKRTSLDRCISNSASALNLFLSLFENTESHKNEYIICVFLDSDNIINEKMVFTSSKNGWVDLDFSKIEGILEKNNTRKMYISHNHPLGVALPSASDLQSTIYLKNICNNLDVELCDHIILAQSSYFSFLEAELL